MIIEQNKSLGALNTFGVGVVAEHFAEVCSAEEFRKLVRDERFLEKKKFILGGGSNTLFTKDFDGLVIKNSIRGTAIAGESDREVIIKAGAGECWHDLVMWCIDRNYAGLENLSLIPGLVGASPIQNIGAYGVEIKDVFHELEAIDMESGGTVRFGLMDCRFGYRDSVFKNELRGRFFITSVSFKLVKLSSPSAAYPFKIQYEELREIFESENAPELSLRSVSDAICRIRGEKLPDYRKIGNAGSFFKNPSISAEKCKKLLEKYPDMPNYPQSHSVCKIPAAWLIEQCGWKGRVIEHMGVHKNHALILVNYGGATGKDILGLAYSIQRSVSEKFGIELSPEVNIV